MPIVHDDADRELSTVVGILGVRGGGTGSDLSDSGSASQPHIITQRGVGAALMSEPLPIVYVNDFTQAAMSAAAVRVNAAGGGTIIVPPGTYPLYDSAGGQVCRFSGCRGVAILGYGAVLAMSTTNAALYNTPGYGSIFDFTNCVDVVVDGFETTGPDMSARFASGLLAGINVVQINSGCSNVRVPNLTVQGAQAAVIFPNAAGNVAPNKNITIGNLDVRETFYGVNGKYGLHNLKIENLRTNDIYRSLFIYGDIYNLHANVWSSNNFGYDCILHASEGYGVYGAKIRYRRGVDSVGPTGDGTRCVRLGFVDSTPATYRDVDIHVEIEFAAGGSTGAGAVDFIKNTGVADIEDTTDRGHVVDGLRISGFIKGTPFAPAGAMIQTRQGTRFGPTLDIMRGIKFEDLTVTGTTMSTAIDWDCAAVRDTVRVDGVNVEGKAVKLRDYAASVAQQASVTAKVVVTGSRFANQYVLDATSGAYPLEVRRLASATEAVAATWMTNIPISNIGIATNPHTNALPAATAGLDATFVNESASIVAWRLDPSGSEVIRGGGAGKYLSLASGASARLRCFTAGKWEILWSSGTTAFEP